MKAEYSKPGHEFRVRTRPYNMKMPFNDSIIGSSDQPRKRMVAQDSPIRATGMSLTQISIMTSIASLFLYFYIFALYEMFNGSEGYEDS